MRKLCRNRLLTLLVFSLLVSSAAAAAGPASARAEWSVTPSARQLLQTRITYSCTDLPIDEMLMDLADLVRIDIIKSPGVTGNVTAKVTNKPLGEMLTNILAAHNYTYIATENMIRVVPIPETALIRDELVPRIYRITYADANEVATALKGFVSDRGRVAFTKGTNHIVVSDVEKNMKAIDQFVEELDRETAQVLVEVRIYDITTKEGFELVPSWHIGRNAPLETTGIPGPTSTTTTTTVTTPGDVSTVGTGATAMTEIGTSNETRVTGSNPTTMVRTPGDQTETAPGNVRTVTTYGPTTEVTTLGEVTRTDTGRTSITGDTTTSDASVVRSEPTTEEQTELTGAPPGTYIIDNFPRSRGIPGFYATKKRRKPFVGGSFDRIDGGALRFSLLNDAVDIDFVLSVLQSQVEAKLLANPRILVVDNETANFEIVREIPYRELRQVAREDPMTYTEFKNVGVSLQVTPHITRDGMLRLHIVPEFGILVAQDMLGVPTVDTRRADTTTLVKDGQTIAIGGLRKRETSKDISKVPVLGDIPLVGGLFKSETESEQITELVVFITTKIVTSPELSQTAPFESHSEQMQREVRGVYKPQLPTARSRGPEQGTDDKELRMMMSLAGAHLKAERYELAIELLGSVIEMQPYNNTAHQYLGYCHLRLHNLDKAIESYSRAIEIDDKDWEAHRGLGVTYMMKAGDSDDEVLKTKAAEHCRLSLDINPDQPNRDLLLGLIEKYSSN
ncbi:MAG: secretin N-terminal domain-containing protein [Phycisphaerales bacterium]